VRGVLTRVRAYSIRHPHFPALHPWVPPGLRRAKNAPLPLRIAPRRIAQGQASAGRLIPTILGAVTLDR
jgi:hypothetical protein